MAVVCCDRMPSREVELLKLAREGEARGLAFTLESVGVQVRVAQIWEPGPPSGWHWVLLVPEEQSARAQAILSEEDPGPAPIPLRPLPPRARPRLYFVVGLFVIHVLVFIAMEGSGGSESRQTLLRFGASYAPAILDGQPWRLVTAIFLHIGFKHLFSNMVSLMLFGVIVLHTCRLGRFYFMYVICGLMGNILSLALDPSMAMKAGASGAILGLLGVLAGSRIRSLRQPGPPSRFKTWHVFAMLLAYYGFVVGMGPVDHLAHVGGLATGLVLALTLPAPESLPRPRERLLGMALGLSAVALAMASGMLQLALGAVPLAR